MQTNNRLHSLKDRKVGRFKPRMFRPIGCAITLCLC